MKTIRAKTGPFIRRPHFTLAEIENTCAMELRSVGLLPTTPEPVRIERFIEKRFGISPTYEGLPDGVLGFTKFGAKGVEEIVVAAALEETGGKANSRRLRTTLAHEAGHGLFHTYLFAQGAKPAALFEETDTRPEILCRDVPGEQPAARGYDGRWWEFQANKAIGGLLLPRALVDQVLRQFCEPSGLLGLPTLTVDKREEAIGALAETFDVNPAVVRIRLSDVLPLEAGRQLSL